MTSLVADMHGTTLAAVPNTSWKKTSVIKQYTDPFGATRGTAAAVPGDRQFLDKTRDKTGLTLVGARYYDERTGRFISLDPLLDLSDPQQWNGYAYANNNPTSLSDPTGLAVSVSIEDDGGRRPSTGPSEPTPSPSAGPAPSPPPATTSRAASPQGADAMCDAAWVAAHPPPKRPWWQRALGYAAVVVVAGAGATFCGVSLGLGCLAIAAGATAAVSFGNNYAIQGQPVGQAATGALIDGAATFAVAGLVLKAGQSFAAAQTLTSFRLGSGAVAGRGAAGGVAANTGDDLVRVGRWMSEDEFAKMSSSGRVVEGGSGRTYVTRPANPDAYPAGKGVFAEFDVPGSSVFPASKPEWGVIPGPNVTTTRFGPPPAEMPPATCIVLVCRR